MPDSTLATVFEVVRDRRITLRIDLGNAEGIASLAEEIILLLGKSERPAEPVARVQVLVMAALMGPGRDLPTETLAGELDLLARRFCARQKDDASGESAALDHDSLLAMVSAFGCGWRRRLGRDGTWEGLWPGAFTSLSKRIRRYVGRVCEELEQQLNVFFPPDDDPRRVLFEVADDLCSALVVPTAPVHVGRSLTIAAGSLADTVDAGLTIQVDGSRTQVVPPGSKAIYQCVKGASREPVEGLQLSRGDTLRLTSSDSRSEVQITSGDNSNPRRPGAGQEYVFEGEMTLEAHACSCGRSDCAERHRLQGWNPEDEYGALHYFLVTAVRGLNPTGAKRTKSGQAHPSDAREEDQGPRRTDWAEAFASGLLGSFWARHGWGDGVRLRMATVVHRVCQNTACREQDPEGRSKLYMGSSCNRCSEPATAKTPLVAREKMLIVVGLIQPAWILREYWRCAAAQCLVPGVRGEQTLIDAKATVPTRLFVCAHPQCRGECWEPAQRSRIEELLQGDGPLLGMVKKLEKRRVKRQCHSCGRINGPAPFCQMCEASGREPTLPRQPTWLFAPAPTVTREQYDESR